jgi:hypothetical protein
MRLVTTILAAALRAGATAAAGAGPAARWKQFTHAHNGARANLGLARAKDGTLHVFSAGPLYAPYPAIYDTVVSPDGHVGSPRPVVSGWDSVESPAAATARDGSIHVLVSGQKVPSPTDPWSGLNEVVGPGSWRLGPHAFGTFQLSVASAADVSTAVLPSGELVSAWRSATSLLFQKGVDPEVPPQNITPTGLAESPAIAVDTRSGEAVVAYRHVATGTDFFRRVLPTLGPPQAMPGAKSMGPSIAARIGGGIYSAYTPDGVGVRLLRFGGKPLAVPVPKGAQVATAAVAAGPEGRLWVFYGNPQTTWVTRTSKGVSGFEPVQALSAPPGAVQEFRLEGEGSAGPLDLFADVTVDGKAKNGSYQTHVLPQLSLGASRSGTRVTVRVTDAGDPVAGARVTGLPGGTRTTDAHGSIVLTAKKGTFRLTATRPGYLPARAGLSV